MLSLPIWCKKWAESKVVSALTLEPHKSLMHHDIQKIISYHNFYLFFPILEIVLYPICKWKEFRLFQLFTIFDISLKKLQLGD